MKPFDFNSAFSRSNEQDASYAALWIHESMQWQGQGVYEKLAQVIGNIESGSLHIDLGTGLGNLPFRLKQLNPQGIIVGVEKNLAMVRNALMFAQSQESLGRPLVYHRELLIHKDKKVESKYVTAEELKRVQEFSPDEAVIIQTASIQPYNEETDKNFLQVDSAVRIVIDDMRSLHLLRSLLDKRQIDSASLTLPGGSGRFAFEAPFQIPEKDFTRSMGEQRITRESERSITGGYDFIADTLRSGGMAVSAHRYLDIVSGDEAIAALISGTRRRMSDATADVFDWSNVHVNISNLKIERPENGVKWLHKGKDIEKGIPMKLSIIKLQKK